MSSAQDHIRQEVVKNWNTLQACRAMLNTLPPPDRQLDYMASMETLIRDTTRLIVSVRRIMREGSIPLKENLPNKHEETKKETAKLVAQVIIDPSSRTTLSVKVGGQPYAQKDPQQYGGPLLRITVGWMWIKRVYDRFYRNGQLERTQWFVLSAEKIKVNHRSLDLYEVVVFNRAINELKKGYIAQTRIAGEEAALRFTVASALAAGEDLIGHAVEEKLVKGEPNEQH